MNQLIDLSTRLVDSIYDQAQLAGKIAEMKIWKTTLERSLIPEGGWPGKNGDERKAAEEKALANNIEYLHHLDTMEDAEKALRDCNATIEALKAEIDTIKWLIRNETNVVLGGRDVFDLLVDAAMERELEAEQDKRDGISNILKDADKTSQWGQVVGDVAKNILTEVPARDEAPDAWLDDRLDADNLVGDDDLPF